MFSETFGIYCFLATTLMTDLGLLAKQAKPLTTRRPQQPALGIKANSPIIQRQASQPAQSVGNSPKSPIFTRKIFSSATGMQVQPVETPPALRRNVLRNFRIIRPQEIFAANNQNQPISKPLFQRNFDYPGHQGNPLFSSIRQPGFPSPEMPRTPERMVLQPIVIPIFQQIPQPYPVPMMPQQYGGIGAPPPGQPHTFGQPQPHPNNIPTNAVVADPQIPTYTNPTGPTPGSSAQQPPTIPRQPKVFQGKKVDQLHFQINDREKQAEIRKEVRDAGGFILIDEGDVVRGYVPDLIIKKYQQGCIWCLNDDKAKACICNASITTAPPIEAYPLVSAPIDFSDGQPLFGLDEDEDVRASPSNKNELGTESGDETFPEFPLETSYARMRDFRKTAENLDSSEEQIAVNFESRSMPLRSSKRTAFDY